MSKQVTGSTETLSLLSNSEYLQRRNKLKNLFTDNTQTPNILHSLDSESIGKNYVSATRSNESVRSIGESETRSVTVVKSFNADFDGDSISGFFQNTSKFFDVDVSYYDLLKGVVGVVDQSEINLPFEFCCFRLNYLAKPVVIYVRQNGVSKEITVVNAIGQELQKSVKVINTGIDFKGQINDIDTVEVDPREYIQHVYVVCIALDAKLVSKKVAISDMGMVSPKAGFSKSVFKILPIKNAHKSVSTHNVNTGRKSPKLHIRRGHRVHLDDKVIFRKWCIVGNIESGIVFKDYAVKV